MSNVEMLLGFIAFVLLVILMYVRWIYLRLEYGMFNPSAPVNQYGENFTDAIQNSHERGLRGISTYEIR
jgi:hypothetical protein